jgi:hypothetical protein
LTVKKRWKFRPSRSYSVSWRRAILEVVAERVCVAVDPDGVRIDWKADSASCGGE